MKTRLALSLFIACSAITTAGCDFQSSLSIKKDDVASGDVKVNDRFKFFIRGKKVSNLSEDLKTITLSIDAADPDGEDLKIEWSQDKAFGAFNSTRGSSVQWTANREGSYTMLITVTVTGSQKVDDPDTASFAIPVVDGKIRATEMAPEITVAPQSVVLFKPLPSGIPITREQLKSMGVKTSEQLTATTYVYDATTNSKVKKSGDFDEIKWTSGDATIITVDDNGYVSPADGSATGKTMVYAGSKTNAASNAASLVSVQYLDTAITLSYPTTTIYLNGQGSPNTVTLGATVKYSNPADRDRVIYTDENKREISWSSSNPAIAQVDSNGKVTPLADAQAGEVQITATSNYDPSKSSSVLIKVKGSTLSNVTFVAE